MAVEATYINNLFPSHQFLSNREIMAPNNNFHHKQQQQQNQILSSAIYNVHQMNSSSAAMDNNNNNNNNNNKSASPLLPFYQSNNNNACDLAIKAESGLTYHQQQIPLQRKRSRDFASEFIASLPILQKSKIQQHQSPFIASNNNNSSNQDALFQFQSQTQSEIDRVLAHHTEKVRMEIEEQKVRQSRTLLFLLQDTMANKLREKDEEIQRMEKLNMALQERVRNLCVENQVWKELAHTNETTANYLRTNLEQILADHDNNNNGGGGGIHNRCAVAAAAADDCESSCGSNGGAAAAEEDTAATGLRKCRRCGERESVVLLLPCRHLCLCTMCGSHVRNCPVCHSGMDTSVHVNLS